MIKKYIFYYLLFIIILFVLLFSTNFLLNKNNKNEPFIDATEYEREKKEFNDIFDKKPVCNNPFFEKNSFCMVNNDKNKCICKFQKDEIRLLTLLKFVVKDYVTKFL